MTKLRKEFCDWYYGEVKNGLISMDFFVGDLSATKIDATVDDVIEENKKINEAIASGRLFPIGDDI